MQGVIKKLIDNKITVATMESCTGGAIANAITSVEGASAILGFSAVTYSNEFKVKMGVSGATIDSYSVYSMEVAREMARNISNFAHSRLGIGITGRLNREDENNPGGNTSMVYIALYDSETDTYYELSVKALPTTRAENKNMLVQRAANLLKDFMEDLETSH